jgi:hypothetical protein
VIAATGLFDYYRYFVIWSHHPTTRAAFTHNLVSIGQYLNALPDSKPRFVVTNTGPMPAQTVIFVTQGHPPATYLLPEELTSTVFPRGSVIVPLAADAGIFTAIRARGIELSEDRQDEFTAGVVR